MGKPKIKTETVNDAITRYFTKDGKEITEEEYNELQAQGSKLKVKDKPTT